MNCVRLCIVCLSKTENVKVLLDIHESVITSVDASPVSMAPIDPLTNLCHGYGDFIKVISVDDQVAMKRKRISFSTSKLAFENCKKKVVSHYSPP